MLDETLKFHAFQSGEFKCDNIFLKLQSKNTEIRHFGPKYKESVFLLENLHLERFEGVDSKYDHGFSNCYLKKKNK